MASTFFGLGIALSGMQTSQTQINTVSNNVANAEVEGYTKQKVITQVAAPLRTFSSAGSIGAGSVAVEIESQISKYYNEKFWISNAIKGEYQAASEALAQIEESINRNMESGFTEVYDDFFNAANSLTNDAASVEKRIVFNSAADALTAYMQNAYDSLKVVQSDINANIKSSVDRVNAIGEELASLNREILAIEINGKSANSLIDQRNLLIDELSTLCNTEVEERVVKTQAYVGGETTVYTVRINGDVLVNGSNNYHLECIQRENPDNQTDVAGLYDIRWQETGERYNAYGKDSGGEISGMLLARDGNNNENLTGIASVNVGDMKVTLTSASVNDLNQLNIPIEGNIAIGGYDYPYSGYEMTVDASGEITYVFNLEEPISKAYTNKEISIGESVNFKGVPYYMNQYNEYVRTFSQEVNRIFNTGVDLYGNDGVDYFKYTDKITGKTYELTEGQTGTIYSNQASYHQMTCDNWVVNPDIMADSSLIAASSTIQNGKDLGDVMGKVEDLKSDSKMFNVGTAADFVSSVITEAAVDVANYTKLSENQQNISDSIDLRRMEVSSVDLDEEAVDLMRFQNAYKLSAEIFSTMSSIYDTLMGLGA